MHVQNEGSSAYHICLRYFNPCGLLSPFRLQIACIAYGHNLEYWQAIDRNSSVSMRWRL